MAPCGEQLVKAFTTHAEGRVILGKTSNYRKLVVKQGFKIKSY